MTVFSFFRNKRKLDLTTNNYVFVFKVHCFTFVSYSLISLMYVGINNLVLIADTEVRTNTTALAQFFLPPGIFNEIRILLLFLL